MTYKIIITQNGKKKKILHKSNDKKFMVRKYFKLKDNNKVLFPKKTSSYLKTHPIQYEIILIKKWEEGDMSFIDRDTLGRTIEINDINKKWTILHKNTYCYEETFTVFGYNKRLTCSDIIKKILMLPHKNLMVKQVNYIKNKLMVHQNNDFDIVLCKCPSDAHRLYTLLQEFGKNNNLKNILFTGSVKVNSSSTYKQIVEKTGWKKNKVYRTTTRP